MERSFDLRRSGMDLGQTMRKQLKAIAAGTAGTILRACTQLQGEDTEAENDALLASHYGLHTEGSHFDIATLQGTEAPLSLSTAAAATVGAFAILDIPHFRREDAHRDRPWAIEFIRSCKLDRLRMNSNSLHHSNMFMFITQGQKTCSRAN